VLSRNSTSDTGTEHSTLGEDDAADDTDPNEVTTPPPSKEQPCNSTSYRGTEHSTPGEEDETDDTIQNEAATPPPSKEQDISVSFDHKSVPEGDEGSSGQQRPLQDLN